MTIYNPSFATVSRHPLIQPIQQAITYTAVFSAICFFVFSPLTAFSVDPLPPNSPNYDTLSVGDAKLENGHYFQARQIFNTVRTKRRLTDVEKIHTLQQLAVIDRSLSQYEQAITQLEAALKLNPNNATTVAEIADTLHAQAHDPFHPKPELARRAHEMMLNAERLDKNNPTVLLRQGDQLLRVGKAGEASQFFETVLNQPHRTEYPLSLYTRLLMANLKQNEHQGSPSYRTRGTNALQSGTALLQFIDSHPDHPDFLLLMARWMSQQHRPKEALEYALQSEQHDDRVMLDRLSFIAHQYQQLGDNAQAIRFYETLIQEAPNHLPTLIALGKLGLNTGDDHLISTYYHRAIQLKPELLEHDLQQAQQAFRQENTALAESLFVKVLDLSCGLASEIYTRATHGLVNTLFLESYYQQPVSAPPSLITALQKGNQTGYIDPFIQLDSLKMSVAVHQQAQPSDRAVLEQFINQPNPMVRGQALFLLRRFSEANHAFDEVDGQTAQGYLEAGDQLLALQALTAATTVYQRGYELEPLPGLRDALTMIQQKRRLAEERLQEGNIAFASKQYEQAKSQYLDAQKIYPDWDVPYLRLGDTHDKLKERESAYYAYTQALAINNAYLSGKPFAKRYAKLKRYTEKTEARRAKSRAKRAQP